MKIYSHRGESKYAPENTMSAFYLSNLLNSDGIECDIRKTKDNELIIIHDKTINRTSNSFGNISDYTYEQLLNFNFGNKNFNNEKIVKLDDFLKYFSDKNMNIFLEIKEEEYEKSIYDIVSKYNLKNITLISFKYNILKKIRKISTDIKIGWLVYDINIYIIKKMNEIKINDLLCLSISINKNDIKLTNEYNIRLIAWGIKNKTELKRLHELGIKEIIYDSYYDAKKVLNNEL